MHFVMRRFIHLFLLLVGIACSCLAQAAYQFTTIDYPGAVSTGMWGINDTGQIVGQAQFADGSSRSFIYETKNGVFTLLPVPGVDGGLIGIDKSAITVGGTLVGTSESGIILKKGTPTFFSHPDWENTEARAISSGLVTGFAYDLDIDGNITDSTGFIYDPAHNSFIDILPSPLTIAQGINGGGQVVGSVFLQADGAYPGSPPGVYGFLRNTSGAITLFRVNDSRTRARGLTDSGVIAGFINTPGGIRAFVGSLSGLPGFESLVIPDAELLNAPGAVNTFAQGINNKLRYVVGAWDDGNPDGLSHGFIATPLPSKTK